MLVILSGSDGEEIEILCLESKWYVYGTLVDSTAGVWPTLVACVLVRA